ncbi:MAG TPA: 50S ribosomal protein L32 [Elusimicrobia bacterium]|nr:50S ribosomal protein L32 [Elusimicrobiota bacterium]
MPNPKRKHTRSRRDSRRASNWRLEIGGLSKCSHCGKMRAPHVVCPSCGFYNNELVLPKKEKRKKGEQPTQEGEKDKE